jgi:hypothetical protein
MDRIKKASKLMDSLGFVLLFGDVSDAELVKIVLWIKDQLAAETKA